MAATYAHRILGDCDWATENAINVVFGFHCDVDKQFAVVVIFFYDFTFDPVVYGKMIFKLQFHVVLMSARARIHIVAFAKCNNSANERKMMATKKKKRTKCAIKMVL